MYRLDHLQEIVDLGLGELVEDGGVALVEWGDVAEPVLGQDSLAVAGWRQRTTTKTDGSSRSGPTGTAWASRWKVLQAELAPWLVA